MKTIVRTPLFVLLFTLITTSSLWSQEQKREYYQLKTYTLANEKQEEATDTYLKNAYLPALKRMGIGAVGVFKIRPTNYVAANKIYVLIPFNSFDQFEKLDKTLASDKAYQSAGSEYINAAHNNAPYEHFTSTFMRAFTEMPAMKASEVKGPRKDRVYELRSYESPTEALYWRKVDMFNAGGEVTLFDSLGFNAVFYAEVLSGDRMPNLMYMTTFTDQKSRDEHWDAFFSAPKWKEISAMQKYKNTVSKADILLLYPTEYSEY